MTLDRILLLANGFSYLALAVAYMATSARFKPPLYGAHFAAYASTVFGILFIARFYTNEPLVWAAPIWRWGVFVFVFGNLWTLRNISTAESRKLP